MPFIPGLHNSTVVITDAPGGIGAATAPELARPAGGWPARGHRAVRAAAARR
jgi:NAD(P)-dependent dehydrogenase (short-subunit alcohol dehydrogenase family)